MSKKFNARKKYEDANTSGGGGGEIRRLKLAVGKNIIRIVEDNFEDAWIHHFKNSEGENKRAICLGRDKCPICKSGNKATHRFYFNVIDRKDQKAEGKTVIKLLECGKMIFDAIKELALDEEYGDPTQYNLKINRKGEGKKTKYSVQASTKQYPLTEEELKVAEEETAEGGAYDLNMFVAKQTRADLEAILTGEEADSEDKDAGGSGKDGDDGDEDEKDEDKEDTPPKKGNKKSKHDDEDEEEDDEDDGDKDGKELDIDKELKELEDDDDDDEDEDEKPKKNVTKDDDEDEEDEDEDDEDEKPKKKKKIDEDNEDEAW